MLRASGDAGLRQIKPSLKNGLGTATVLGRVEIAYS
jgi:hypothetical protein